MTPTPAPDAIRARNQEIEALLDDLLPRLVRIVASHRIPEADLEDLIQEAVLGLVRRWDTVRAPRYWLTGSVYQRCRDYWRNRRRTSAKLFVPADDVSLEYAAATGPPSQHVLGDLLDLAPQIAALPPRHRTVVLGRALGYSDDELAHATGYASATIRDVRAAAQKRLRTGLLQAGQPQS